MTKIKDIDIVLFPYISTPKLPEDCFIDISNDIAHRNLFLYGNMNSTIHFEYPSFEDHTYCSSCNTSGVNSLFKRKSKEKYLIFRTKDQGSNEVSFVGYYKVGEMYYQKTKMFDNNGFVLGIKAKEVKLIKRGEIIKKASDTFIRRKYNVSWSSKPEIKDRLFEILNNIKDISYNDENRYRDETNKIISIFKNKSKLKEWNSNCQLCSKKKKCFISRKCKQYSKMNQNYFDILNYVYTSNLYSKNVLNQIEKVIIKKGV